MGNWFLFLLLLSIRAYTCNAIVYATMTIISSGTKVTECGCYNYGVKRVCKWKFFKNYVCVSLIHVALLALSCHDKIVVSHPKSIPPPPQGY